MATFDVCLPKTGSGIKSIDVLWKQIDPSHLHLKGFSYIKPALQETVHPVKTESVCLSVFKLECGILKELPCERYICLIVLYYRHLYFDGLGNHQYIIFTYISYIYIYHCTRFIIVFEKTQLWLLRPVLISEFIYDKSINKVFQSFSVRCNYLPHGPHTSYVNLWVAHAPGMPGTFSPPPTSKETAS